LEKEGNSTYILNENDHQEIEKLSVEKFNTWEWNFGYSPKYSFKNELAIDGKILKIEMNVQKGIIMECLISGDYYSAGKAELLSFQLQNKRHFFEDVKAVLNSNSEKLIYSFF
jgi:lipoate-protein ligase A